jgi:hypothetical protein
MDQAVQTWIPGAEPAPEPAPVLREIDVDIDAKGRWTAYLRPIGSDLPEDHPVRFITSKDRGSSLGGLLAKACREGWGISMVINSADRNIVLSCPPQHQ